MNLLNYRINSIYIKRNVQDLMTELAFTEIITHKSTDGLGNYTLALSKKVHNI